MHQAVEHIHKNADLLRQQAQASDEAGRLTEDTVREVCLPLGLVDNKVCAIDDVWSGLRVVWRMELRPAKRAEG